MKQAIYKNRLDVVLEEMNNLTKTEEEYINEIKLVKEENLTDVQKKIINMLYVKQKLH